jgi:hypothetical protein
VAVSIQLGFDPVARAQVYMCVFEDFMSMLNGISYPRDQDSPYLFFDGKCGENTDFERNNSWLEPNS